MKKIIFLITIFFLAQSYVSAQNSGGNGQGNAVPKSSAQSDSVTPGYNQVRNQNQVETQNQGEENELNVNTQEQESLGNNKPNPRSENAREHMSNVATQVEQLLAMPERQGGIGEQVREIAQQQNQTQSEINNELTKLESRGTIKKRLFGTDFKAIKNLNQHIEQNRLRIQQLEMLMNETQNEQEQTQLQEAIRVLTEQNTALEEQIKAEEQYKSLFGWLLKYFAA